MKENQHFRWKNKVFLLILCCILAQLCHAQPTCPIAVCKDITVSLHSGGQANISPFSVNNGSFFICGGPAFFNLSPRSFDCNDVGPNTVTLSISAGGNIDTCTAIVTILPYAGPPEARCNDLTVYADNNGQANYSFADIDGGSSDHCGTSTNVLTPTSLDCDDNYVLNFDGINDHISVPDQPRFDFTNQLTMMAWIKPDINEFASVISRPRIFGVTGIGLFTRPNGELMGAFNNGPFSNTVLSDSMLIKTNEWNHVALTYNGTSLTVYHNGVAVGTKNFSRSLAAGSMPLLIGTQTPILNAFFTGDMDEVSVWDVALSATDIASMYQHPLNGNEPGLVVYYDYNDGDVGTTITDKSINGFNGTLTNMDPATDYVKGAPDSFMSEIKLVTLTVTDAGGIADSCVSTVTVLDTIAPTSICNDLTLYANAAGQVDYTPADIDGGSTDNCCIDSLSINPATLNCMGSVSNSVTLTVTDISGNTSSCVSNVTISDTLSPTISCPADISVIPTTSNCDTTLTIPMPSVTDNCAVFPPAGSPADPFTDLGQAHGAPAPGIYHFDVNGNQFSTYVENGWVLLASSPSTATTDLTITSNVTLQSNTIVPPAVYADSTIDRVRINATSGPNLPLDVESTDPGVLANLRANIILSTGLHGGINEWTGAGAASRMTFSCLGSQTINFTLDKGIFQACNNGSGLHWAPSVAPSGLPWVSVDLGNGFNDLNLWASAPATTVPLLLTNDYNNTSDASDTYPLGTTAVTWTASDANGSSSCTMNVTVVDTIFPTISCPPDITVSNDTGNCSAALVIPMPVVTDNCVPTTPTGSPGDPFTALRHAHVASTPGIYHFDVNGNQFSTYVENGWVLLASSPTTATTDLTITANVTLQSNSIVPPSVYADTTIDRVRINATGGPNLPLDVESTDPGVLANLRANVILSTGLHGGINEWTGTGAASRMTYSCTGPQTTSFTLDRGIFQACGNGGGLHWAPSVNIGLYQWVNVDFENGTNDLNLWASAPALSSPLLATNDYNNTSDASDTYPLGVTAVTWTVADPFGNSSQCTMNVEVQDTEAPSIICPPDAFGTALPVPGLCLGTATIGTPIVSDNCTPTANLSVINKATNLPFAPIALPVGINPVTLSVTDLDGNTAECTFNVTITNLLPPSISCPPNMVVDPAIGQCTASVTVGAPTFSADCGAVTITNDFNNTANASGIYPTGVTTVTWTATDMAGTTSQCNMTVEVRDTIAPTITCPPDYTGMAIPIPGFCRGPAFIGLPTVTDNCTPTGSLIISNNQNNIPIADGIYPVGITPVIFTVTDQVGNTAQCVVNVTISEINPPSLSCPANLFVTTDVGQCTANVTVPIPTFSGECTPVTLLNDFNNMADASGIYNKGVTTVTWTATDGAGGSSQCSITVEVLDTENPVIACPADITVNANPPACNAAITIPAPTLSDNCSSNANLTLINDFNNTADASGTYPVGQTTVTFTVNDEEFNFSSCAMLVTVVDTAIPVAKCKDLTLYLPGNFTILTPADINDNSTVGCVNPTLSIDNNFLECWENGRTRTLTVSSNGQSSSCQSTITLLDTTLPTLICPVDIVVNATAGTCGAFVNVPIPFSDDNCNSTGGIIPTNDFNNGLNASDTYPVGITSVVWTVRDLAFNTTQCTMTVTVLDNEAPVAVCNDITVDLDNTGNGVANPASLTGSSTDNCGIANSSLTVSNYSCADVGPHTVTVTVTDSSGNVDSCVATITVRDAVAPTLTCPVNVVEIAPVGQCDKLLVVGPGTINDNCSVFPNFTVTNDYNNTANATDIYPVGVNTVTWTITDEAGNPAQCTMTVTVLDNEAPVAVCNDVTIDLDNTGNTTANPASLTGSSTDNCGIAGSSLNVNSFSCADVGPNNVTLTVTDSSGNVDSCMATITVSDTTPPVITCPMNVVETTAPGQCNKLLVVGAGTIADNCSVFPNFTVTNDYNNTANATDNYPAGVTTVTWTVADQAGNAAQCTMTVTVIPDSLAVTDSISDYNGFEVSCDGFADGSIHLSVSDICGTLQYNWSDGATTANRSGLVAGTYSVTISTTAGQSETRTYNLTAPTALVPTVSVLHIKCRGAASGKMAIPVSGGVAPYNYNWSNGATTGLIMNLAPGVYQATITDQNGCSLQLADTVTEPDTFTIAVQLTDTITCGDSTNGALDVTTNNLTGPYQYSWSDGSGVISTANNVTGLSSGTYFLTVKDNFNCELSDTIVIDDSTELDAFINLTSNYNGRAISCFGASDADLSVNISGGVTPYTIVQWKSIPVVALPNTTTQTNLGAGAYKVKIQDAEGCIVNANIMVNDPDSLQLDTVIFDNILCPDRTDGAINPTISGGTMPYTYNWSNILAPNNTNLAQSNLGAGMYTLSVTDANGCQWQNTWNVASKSNIQFLTNITNESCGADGRIRINIRDGASPYTVTYSDGFVDSPLFGTGPMLTAQSDHNGIVSGTYSFIITDIVGCQAFDTVFVGLDSCIITPIASSMSRSNGEEEPDGKTIDAPKQGSLMVKAYPNPFSDQVTVQISNLTEGETVAIQIIDINGRVVYHNQLSPETSESKFSIDLSDYAKGVYLINIQTSIEQHSIKMQKVD